MTGTGTFSVKTTNPAEILYKPSIADVAQSFKGWLYISAYLPPSNTIADEVIWGPIGGSATDATVPFQISPI